MTFVNPAALWLLAAIPGLLALYFLKFRRPNRPVASTEFWRSERSEREANSFFRRWRPTRQLWLQLLALVAVALALARPAVLTPRGGGAREILVIDRGVGMQATDVPGSRFARAREDALARIDRLGAAQEAMVIGAGPRAQIVTRFTDDKAALRRAVSGLEPADAQPDLVGALRLAVAEAEALPAADLVFFSARAWPDVTDERVAADLRGLKGRVRLSLVQPAGASGWNVGITAMEVRARYDRPSAYELFVSLANASEREASFTLTVRQDGALIDTERVRLAARVRRSFAIPVEARGGSRLEARIDAKDDLAVDNTAYAVVPTPVRLEVALVTTGNQFLVKAIGADRHLALSVFRPSAYPGPGAFDVVVFDGFIPERLPAGRYVFVNTAPPALIQSLGTVEAPTPLEWDRAHPVLRNVDFSRVLIKEAMKVRPLTGARPLVESALTPLALAYEGEGVRWVFIGFDLRQSDFPLRVGFPLFVSNAVRWTRPTVGDGAGLQPKTGATLELPMPKGATEVVLSRPDGGRDTLQVLDGTLRLPPLTRAGLYGYRIRGRRADGGAVVAGESRFAVNLADEVASDITPRGRLPVDPAEFAALGRHETPPGPVRQEVWQWPVALALLAILADCVIEVRRWRRRPVFSSAALRVLAILLVSLALFGVRVPLPDDRLNVVFLIDESQSVAPVARERALGIARDQMARMRPDDAAAVVGFGGTAKIRVPLQGHPVVGAWSPEGIDPGATDIEGAIRLGLGTFPAAGARRLVVMSDGNETRGRAIEAARLAREEGADLFAIPVISPGEGEVLVESVTMPSEVKAGESFEVKVVVRSRQAGRGRLSLYRNGQHLGSRMVRYDAGPTAYTFGQTLDAEGFHVYSARLDTDTDQEAANNSAVGVTAVHGRPMVLLVERDVDEAHHLQRALARQGIGVEVMAPGRLPSLRAGARRYDGIILSNVSSLKLSKDQMEDIRAFVRDDGGGLVMLGGDESFGLGGYYRTPVEEALPVSMDSRQKIDMPNLSVVIVIDKSMSMDIRKAGEPSKLDLAKMAAQYAVELMDARDEVGILTFDESFDWPVPFGRAATKEPILRAIGAIKTGGATEMYPAMHEAFERVKAGRGALKHIILLTDGQSTAGDFVTLAREIAADKITISSVAIGKDAAVNLMRDIAFDGGGRFYFVEEATQVPRIFTRETQLATKSVLMEEPFRPVVTNRTHEVTQGIDWRGAPPLGGYVATTAKPTADVLLATPHQDPLLAVWRFGLGRSAAFTSDAKAKWGYFWLGWPEFPKVMGQAVRWTLRTQKPRTLQASVEVDGGRGTVRIDAVDQAGKFIDFADIRAGVVSPDKQLSVVAVQQVAPGRYEARFDARQTGAYLVGIDPKLPGVNRSGSRVVPDGPTGTKRPGAGDADSQIASVVVPYSPELRDLSPNVHLLEAAAKVGGGRVLEERREKLDIFGVDRRVRTEPVDVWWAAASLGLLLFLIDVALQRIGAVRRRWRAAGP